MMIKSHIKTALSIMIILCFILMISCQEKTELLKPTGSVINGSSSVVSTITGTSSENSTSTSTGSYLNTTTSTQTNTITNKPSVSPNVTSSSTVSSIVNKPYTPPVTSTSQTSSVAESHEHTPVVDEAIAATCSANGLTEGSHCSTCGAVIVEQKEISPKDHTIVVDKGYAATLYQSGMSDGKYCSVCKTVFTQKQTIAPTFEKAATQLKSKLPVITYAMPASNASKVYSYSDSSLSTVTSGYYIDSFSDEIIITQISSNNKAVLVTYPSSTAEPRSRWFKTEDILGLNTVSINSYTAGKNANTYRLASTSTVTDYGAIYSGDTCISFGTHTLSGSTYYPTIYNISATSLLGVTGIKNKMALATVSTISSGTSVGTPSQLENLFISTAKLQAAASSYGFSTSSNPYKALQLINSKYASKLTSAQKSGVLVFLFEGVGNDSSASKRLNAMCVVVKNGNIAYLNRNCSTIPDYPFDPSKNDGTAMPTIKSGIYSFTTTNHLSKYAALNVTNAQVVRFNSKSSYYDSTSAAINIHRRSTDYIPSSSAGWVNSAGCSIVGLTGTGSSGEYANFIKSVGIVGSSATGATKYQYSVTGKVIYDRSYARTYLTNVGYPSGAIDKLG